MVSGERDLPLRLLIAEDSPEDAELIVYELRQGGFQPTWRRVETENEYVTQLHNGWDIVLSDYDMPQFSAPRALELLQESGRDIPFIVITGKVSEEVAVDTMRQGADDYLFKDRLVRLPQAIMRAMGKKRLEVEKRRAESQRESALKALRYSYQELEQRVRQRTVDLETANRHLEEQAVELELQAQEMQLANENLQNEIARRIQADEIQQRAETQREAALQALRESEERYRQLFQTIQEAFFVLELIVDDAGQPVNYRYLEINPVVERMLGKTRAEVVGRNSTEVLGVINLTVLDEISHVASTGQPAQKEIFFSNIGQWHEVFFYPLGQGRVASLGIDITERKQAVEALRLALAEAQSKGRLLDVIMENVPDGITIADAADMTIGLVSRYGQNLLGGAHNDMTAVEVVEQWRVYEPDGVTPMAEENLPLVRAIRQGEIVRDREIVQVNSQGQRLALLCNAAPIRDGNGQIVGGIVAWRDITKRRQAEERMAQARDRLQQTLDSIAEGYYALDAEWRFVAANWLAEKHFGRPLAEMLGQNIWEMTGTPADSMLFQRFNEAIETQRPIHFEAQSNLRPDFWAEMHLYPRNGVLDVYFTDISDRKQSEQNIQELNHALEQHAVEMETANQELESFAYSVSHDLRAPLRVIDGFSRMLLDTYADQMPGQALHNVQVIRSHATKMDQLINALLGFSRLGRQPIQKRAVNPEQQVRQVIQELRPEGEGRQVEISVGPLPEYQADPLLLKQVWANLIGNAVKFTRQRETARIEIGSFSQDERTVYFVRDNGAGFDMRAASRLFGVFQRLHAASQFEGTGVGLANVKRIITRHGGSIWAEAQPDQGATFYFTL